MHTARANRRARSHFGRRRRRSIFFAGGSAATAMLATVFTAANFAGVDIASAAVEKARSFLQLMSQRSPGERVKGELIKTKGRKYRVLAERSPAEMPVPPLTGALADVIAPPATLPGVIELPSALLIPPAGLPPGVTIFPPPGIIVGPCCAVGPPPPPPGPPPPGPPPPGPPPPPPPPPPPGPPPPPPPPAVPEPGTWMTMILGFGLTGWLLRRRRDLDGRLARR